MKKNLSFLILLLLMTFCLTNLIIAQAPEKFQQLIDNGEFSNARRLLRQELATNYELDPLQRVNLIYEIEKLDRIEKDFTRTSADMLNYINQFVPDVAEKDLVKWELEKSLECMMIDGQKRYFKWAGPNLFRINAELKKIKNKKEPSRSSSAFNRSEYVKGIILSASSSGKKFVKPLRARVTYTLTVPKNAVPDGKIIRCWLPFPREIPNRQTDITLISSTPERSIISPNDDYLQRTIYLEQPALTGEDTRFQVVFEFTNHAVYQKIDPEQVTRVGLTPELLPFVSERPPHVVFTGELQQLSKAIVNEETNPYLIARKIFKWIEDNIPWASAREYSTFDNITDYVYQNRHGDCGMKTLFFITLCRMNGIPTRWQSGWWTEPGNEGMHDWGEIYFEPYGWLPVDVTNGLQESKNEVEKWFFLGGMDAFRLIVSDDYSQNLYPAKMFFRSETIDFQRGEVEWEGGNLYFDQWDYDYKVELLNEPAR